MFKVGDLVQWGRHQGRVAVIDDDGWYGVDFGRDFDGHNLFWALRGLQAGLSPRMTES